MLNPNLKFANKISWLNIEKHQNEVKNIIYLNIIIYNYGWYKMKTIELDNKHYNLKNLTILIYILYSL